MGNDNSRLKGLEIDKKTAVESNDFYSIFNGQVPISITNGEYDCQKLTIFQGEKEIENISRSQLWNCGKVEPIERAIKNLMIYRHPYILKYVATWEESGLKHLATERVRPLTAVLLDQSDIQICLGLRTILCSLIFLVEKAMARHLNVCLSSIYITEQGSWRLAGFEYVWKKKEITPKLLTLANEYRHKSAIDKNESKENHSDFIEQYAFATLCEEIFTLCEKQTKADVTTPHVEEFREYCAVHLKHQDALMRPRLSAILLHPYFNHEFVLIHSFLFELPLKGMQEKQDFFTSLVDRLRYFNEETVASQLSADLLSRMVLLDPTAQLCVTPYVLKTKNEYTAALFSNQTYIKYLLPHIRRMFRLRDAQIRLILLQYFMEYVRLLSKEELQEFILPHLIEGMKDTNDVLVAKTLHCLGDLVPLLGAHIVLGGERTRIFSDGRPQAAVSNNQTGAENSIVNRHWTEPRSITPVMDSRGHRNDIDDENFMVSGSPLPSHNHMGGSFNSIANHSEINDERFVMAEDTPLPGQLRQSPDGGEDDSKSPSFNSPKEQINPLDAVHSHLQNADDAVKTLDEKLIVTVENSIPQVIIETQDNSSRSVVLDDDEDAWSDWETNDSPLETEKETPSNVNQKNLIQDTKQQSKSKISHVNQINDDLNALDIQVQTALIAKNEKQNQEFDFFKDMEPIIQKNPIANIVDLENNTSTNTHDEIHIDNSRFAITTDPMTLNNSEPSLNLNCDDALNNGWDNDDDDDDDGIYDVNVVNQITLTNMERVGEEA